MIFDSVAPWFPPIIGSAVVLGFYDLCKKHAMRDNPVMPVLFFATLSGSTLFLFAGILTGNFFEWSTCSFRDFLLLFLKSAIVSGSWSCVYYAMRELPISIAAPIRASSPLWTFFGSLILFQEIPTLIQAFGMICIFSGYYLFSVFGKLEGISFWKHRGMRMIFLGTLLGACAALYDKYLLNSLGISRYAVQFWFSVDLVVILGLAYLIKLRTVGNSRKFCWRWTIPVTGILLIAADALYFYAVSLPDIQISILSLIRRCNCLITFLFGVYLFKEKNILQKGLALFVILLGVFILMKCR